MDRWMDRGMDGFLVLAKQATGLTKLVSSSAAQSGVQAEQLCPCRSGVSSQTRPRSSIQAPISPRRDAPASPGRRKLLLMAAAGSAQRPCERAPRRRPGQHPSHAGAAQGRAAPLGELLCASTAISTSETLWCGWRAMEGQTSSHPAWLSSEASSSDHSSA